MLLLPELIDTSLRALAKAWSTVLSKSDAELGIDSEFTRPGTEALLSIFRDKIDGGEVDYQFNWDAYKPQPVPIAAADNAEELKKAK